VQQSGTLQLQLIAPSSVGAPPGRIWLDDVALYEYPMPELTCVSEGRGFNDWPTMAKAPDGSLYVAWISFRQGHDTIQLARYRLEGSKLQRVGHWQPVGGPDTYILNPRLISTSDSVYLLYAAEVDGNWDIYAIKCSRNGPGPAIRITKDEAVDIKPAATGIGGKLAIAWESNRNGPRQIFLATLQDGQVSEPQLISSADVNSYGPSVAARGDELWVAWHSFKNNNYDVWLRRRDAAGKWHEPVRITKAPTIDRHPRLFTNESDLWLIYENARINDYRISTTNFRRLLVAKVSKSGDLLWPRGYSKRSPLYGRCEGGSAAFDHAGRLWLAYLTPRPPRSGWDVRLTCLAGDTWAKPMLLSLKKGMDRPPALAIAGNYVVVAFQSDNLPRTWSEVDKTLSAKSEISLCVVPIEKGPPARSLALEKLVEPAEPAEVNTLRVQRGEDLRGPTIEYAGKKLRLFYGDFHEHTDISVCNRLGDQSVDESYQCLRDIAALDFAAATDHGYNINPYLWHYLGKMARANTDPGRFLAFLGEEWTSSFEEYSKEHPYGFYGHRNLIFADPYFPRWWNSRNRQTPAEVWQDLRKLKANFIHIPHQLADTGNVPTDWNFVDETAQPVAEIFQVRGSYEYYGAPRQAVRSVPEPGYYIQDAWAKGIVIGVIASPDHGGGLGKACVYATDLSRKAILDALRARHSYGTTAAKIILDVRVNGHLMGEKVTGPAQEPVEVLVRVKCPATIERVEVCRNNQFIFTRKVNDKEASFKFIDTDKPVGSSYYYVRVVQQDGEIAWSSPVWFGAE